MSSKPMRTSAPELTAWRNIGQVASPSRWNNHGASIPNLQIMVDGASFRCRVVPGADDLDQNSDQARG